MSAFILALATAVPPHAMNQTVLGTWLSERLKLSPEKQARLCKIFDHSAIDTRHFSIPDCEPNPTEASLYPLDLTQSVPGTAARNQFYKEKALPLATRSAQAALKQWGGPIESISHVVSVSCTGMMAPGLEFLLIDSLGLRRDVERLALNFMGCFGAIRGLSVAKALATENPRNRVLLVCTELCSLHFQADQEMDTFIANALFADGSAAVVVGAQPLPTESPQWELVQRHSFALLNSKEDMTWDSSDHGYVMRLSHAVPFRLHEAIKPFVERLTASQCMLNQCSYVVHPGGKAILHKVAQALGLQRSDLEASWEVMRQFGNMSSATVLFVLERTKVDPHKPWAPCLAFGPGLSIEGFLLRSCCGKIS